MLIMNSLQSTSNPIRSLRAGMQIDAYKLVKRKGRSQSAEVWQAKVVSPINGVELKLDDIVAIKFYGNSLMQGFQPLRIHREFAVASDVVHENIAKVYDLLISPSRPFYTFMVMEFIDGPTLKEFIKHKRKIAMPDVLLIGFQLFSALAELHSMGAIHRDVKAANIMVSQDKPVITIKLVDLGIVAILSEANLTQGSMFLGSKHSAPLEQLTGIESDERADIYGAGSVLYHCIRGVPMYNDVGPEGAIVKKMLEAPERLQIKEMKLSPVEIELYEFVNQCISVKVEDRPSTVEECIINIARLKKLLNDSNSLNNSNKSLAKTMEQVLLNSIFRLYFNPKVAGLSNTKIMKFAENGAVLEGQNENEFSWRIINDHFEFLNSEGKVFSRFTFDMNKKRFSNTNDGDTLVIQNMRIRDQYMVLEKSA